MAHRPRIAVALIALAGAALPPAALARGGDDRAEVRAAGSCGRGASAELKLKADDGALEVEFEVDGRRAGERWRVVLTRERRVVARTTTRTTGRSGSFSVERRISDLSGADRVTARGTGPGGLTCTATATLHG